MAFHPLLARLFVVFAVTGGMMKAPSVLAQGCSEDMLAQTSPSVAPEGFTPIKRFYVQPGKTLKAEFSYVVGRGTDYLIVISGADGKAVPVKLSVLDAYHQPLFGNYDKRNKRYMQKLGYVSQTTSVIHLEALPEQGFSGCYLIQLAFRPS